MKKYLFLLLSALAIFAAVSCEKEVDPCDLSEADAPVIVSVQIPDGIQTKAYGDGLTVDKVYFEIWSEDFGSKIYEAESALSDKSATFDFKLVRGVKYSFVFWAIKEQNRTAEVYSWENLSAITLNYGKLNADANGNPAGNSEVLDAFYSFYTTDPIKGGENLNVTLKRPFAQLNIATDDMTGTTVGDITLNSSSITVDGIANVFNATTGLGSDAKIITFVSSAKADGELVIDSKTYSTLSMNYLLPSGNESATTKVTAKFNITYNTSETKDVTQKLDVPIKANYRTNVVGSLFTAAGSVTTSINPAFATPAGQVTVNPDGTTTTTPIS